MNTLVVGNYKNNMLGFLLEGNSLSEIVEFTSDSHLGSIFTARVVKVVNTIDAAFLEAGIGDTLYYSLRDNQNKNVFIRHTAASDKVCEGDILLVQVCKDSIKTKKAEATADLSFYGDNIIINRSGTVGVSKKITDAQIRDELKKTVEETINNFISENVGLTGSHSNIGAIIRTSAADISRDDLRKETINLLCKLNQVITLSRNENSCRLFYEDEQSYTRTINEIRKRYPENEFKLVEDDDALITYDIDTKLSKLMKRNVYLNSGGYLTIDYTEAMTVIDVNSGKAITGKDKEKMFLKVNMEAAEMLARILRVRNLSGMIIVDFISMKDADNYHTLIEYIRNVLSKDRIPTVYVDTTGLGLVEITRQKKHRPIHELLH